MDHGTKAQVDLKLRFFCDDIYFIGGHHSTTKDVTWYGG
jgi:hypothetical protein